MRKIKEKTPKEKPRWNIWQTTVFMCRSAVNGKHRELPFMCVGLAVLTLGRRLAELYITPGILRKIETSAPLGELLGAIAFFTCALLLLKGAYTWLNSAMSYSAMHVRLHLSVQMTLKYLRTAYPNMEDPAVRKLYDKGKQVCMNGRAAGERIWEVLFTLCMTVLSVVIWASLLSRVHPLLLIVIVAGAVASVMANRRIMARYYANQKAQMEPLSVMEYVWGREADRKLGKDLRIFGLGSWLEELYTSAARLYRSIQTRQEWELLWMEITEVIVTFCRQGVAYFFLINLALRDGLSAADFLLYFTAAGNLAEFVTSILTTWSELSRFNIDLSMLREFLEYPEPFRFEDGKPVEDKICRELRLKNVSFKYPGAEDYSLRNIDLTIRPGEKLAIVGLNGAGKTTLVRLLCGLYDPTEGEVLLNGKDIRQYDRRAYYELFSTVLQDYALIDTTIAENVSSGEEHPDTERVMACLKLAGLEEMIKKQPDGIQTNLGRNVHEDGKELSGGETQRLLLARALYKNGPYLVLDEPTAALDPLAEHDIYTRYNEMCRDKSALFISHRLASTRFCDRILFMEHGQIIETGTHEQLLKKKGAYASLFEVQARYYQEGELKNV